MISVEGLRVEFGVKPLFADASFVVNDRDRIALVGKNGAGKSTLLKILCGMQHPTAGTVSVPQETTIGYLPQVMRDAVEVADGAAQTTNDVLRVAMLLFLNFVDAATTIAETVGGGGGVESGWGRKKDDDDEEWARRCAHKAAWLCKPMRKSYKR